MIKSITDLLLSPWSIKEIIAHPYSWLNKNCSLYINSLWIHVGFVAHDSLSLQVWLLLDCLNVGQLFLWSLSRLGVLDMLVSLTDGRCPRYSCMPTLIHSHLPMSSLARNPVQSPAVAGNNLPEPTQLGDLSFPFYASVLLFLHVHVLEEIKSAIAAVVHSSLCVRGLYECFWMPLPVCDSWHMAPLYLHQPESTPQTAAILAVHQGSKLVLVIRTDSLWEKQRLLRPMISDRLGFALTCRSLRWEKKRFSRIKVHREV